MVDWVGSLSPSLAIRDDMATSCFGMAEEPVILPRKAFSEADNGLALPSQS